MDQSKWALPRNRLAQSSKEVQGLIRPKVKIQGVWIHGVSLTLYLLHPGIPSDSSTVCECLMRAIQDTVGIFDKHQKRMPREIFTWVLKLHVGYFESFCIPGFQ